MSLAAGYATFANGGYKVTPYFIDRVTTADGEVLYESKPLICAECNTPPETPVAARAARRQSSSPTSRSSIRSSARRRASSRRRTAFLVSDMLKDVVTRGSGTRALDARSAKTWPARRARRTKAATRGSSASTPTSSARRGWDSTNSARSAVTSKAAERRSRCGSTSCARRSRHGRAAAETPSGNRRIPHQSRRPA